MGDKVTEFLMYGGISKKEFSFIEQEYRKGNQALLTKMSVIAMVIFGSLSVLYLVIPEELKIMLEGNLGVYLFFFAASALCFIASRTIAGADDFMLQTMVHLFLALMYSYGVMGGTLYQRDTQATVFKVLLVVLPLLFNSRPYRVWAMSIFFALSYIFMTIVFKNPELLGKEIISMLVFLVMGMMISGPVINLRIQYYLTSHALATVNAELVKTKIRMELERSEHRTGFYEEETSDKRPSQKMVDAMVNLDGRRILMAEDNELNSDIAVEILTDAGFNVETAENGRIACDRLLEKGPGYYDLVLMDIQMPVMDGYEATREIRRLADPVLSKIPVIAMTANAFEEDRKAAFDAGMNEHVAKPIDIDKLTEAFDRILEHDTDGIL